MKKLVVISLGYNTGQTIYHQLCNLFSSILDIEYYFLLLHRHIILKLI